MPNRLCPNCTRVPHELATDRLCGYHPNSTNNGVCLSPDVRYVFPNSWGTGEPLYVCQKHYDCNVGQSLFQKLPQYDLSYDLIEAIADRLKNLA